jgi:hypothetical protein
MLEEVIRTVAPAKGFPFGSRTTPVSAAVVLLWAIKATGAATSARTSEVNLRLLELLAITPPGLKDVELVIKSNAFDGFESSFFSLLPRMNDHSPFRPITF